jgi:hypothetical protein
MIEMIKTIKDANAGNLSSLENCCNILKDVMIKLNEGHIDFNALDELADNFVGMTTNTKIINESINKFVTKLSED